MEKMSQLSSAFFDQSFNFSQQLQQVAHHNQQTIKLIDLLFECMGYLALKECFKTQFLAKIEEHDQKGEEGVNPFIAGIRYMILESLHSNFRDGEKDLHDKVSAELGIMSSLTFFILNMVRSDDYDILVPSHTLKIHDALKDKEISYYELKQLGKAMKNSSKLLGQLTQKFANEYGSEQLT